MERIHENNKEEKLAKLKEYHNALDNNFDLQRLAGSVRSWYCAQDLQGNWQFGAARYIAYRNLTPAQYDKDKTTSDANEHLAQWAERVENKTEFFEDLSKLLAAKLSKVGKSPRKNCSYYLIRR